MVLSVAAATAAVAPTLPRAPGERFAYVTQANLRTTVCFAGWTRTIRPPSSYTSALKRWQLAQWGYADLNPAHYQEDHLISLELGGAPYSNRNLWPQPIDVARQDDQRENHWHKLLCDGTLNLRQAQKAELTWKRSNG